MTAKDVLKSLDDAAVRLHPKERRKLWDILTALRGPDGPSFGSKANTTAIIRGKAFPRWIEECDLGEYAEVSNSGNFSAQIGNHFITHAYNAGVALNLIKE